MAEQSAQVQAQSGMLRIDIVAPQRRLVLGQCTSIVLPGEMGEFEVLPGHTPFLSALKIGVVTIKGLGDVSEGPMKPRSAGEFKLMVAGGFVEISNNSVTVLAEAAALPEEIDAKTEQEKLKQLHDKMRTTKPEDETEFNVIAADIEAVSARLQLL
jgi:F-type H+-transporting ATPase subunit epsilon